MILWLKVILWHKLLKLWRITSQNQEKLFFPALSLLVHLFFSALSLLVHFRESLHRISSILSEKLFGTAIAGFNGESTLGALPNAPLL
jgi:hypothetical protein